MSDTRYRCDLPVHFSLVDARTEPAVVKVTEMPIHETTAYTTLWGAVFPAQLLKWSERSKITYTVTPAVDDTLLATYAIPEGELCNCSLHEGEVTNV